MSDRRAVVIGAGVTGVLTARALRSAGWAVSLLDQDHVGAGSSSRTAAGIRQQFSTSATVRAMRFCVAAYRELEAKLGARILEPQGYLFLHDDPAAWSAAKARVQMQVAAGLAEVEALPIDALRQRFGWVSPELLGGTWCPSDGFLRPEIVYGDGARDFVAAGGTLRTRAHVVGCEVQGERIVAVQLEDGSTLGADLFVDATNAWTGRTAQALGGTALPVEPIKRHLWFLRREGSLTAEDFATMPLVVSPSGVYARPENRDTLLMGWARGGHAQPRFVPEEQDRVEPDFAHDAGVEAVPYEAWSRFAEAVPGAAELGGMTATTAGFYAITPDHNPFLGFDPARSNLLRLVGFSGHGVMMAPFSAAVALAMAEAGRDVGSVSLSTGEVSLAAFAISRTAHDPEHMVI